MKEDTKLTSIRIPEDLRIFASNHGITLTDGVIRILELYKTMVKNSAPRKMFTSAELSAIAGATKGLQWQHRIATITEDIACNVEDYPHCETAEASQWDVSYEDLSAKVRKLSQLEAISIMNAVEEFFFTGKNMHEIIPARS